MKEQRVCVFIDGSNLYFALKRNNRMTRVDYHQFSLALVGEKRRLVRTYYYNAAFEGGQFADKAKGQQSFFDSLDRTPYLELRLGRIIQNREGNRLEKGVDVRMAADMVYYAARDAYDIALVVTEDQDFSHAMGLVKDLGKQVELAAFPDGQNREILRAADRILPMDDLLNARAALVFPPSQEDRTHPEEMAYRA